MCGSSSGKLEKKNPHQSVLQRASSAVEEIMLCLLEIRDILSIFRC